MSVVPSSNSGAVLPSGPVSGTGTLTPPTVDLTVLDLSTEDAADLTGESSVSIGGVTWTLANAANMTTLEFDGTTGLDATQTPDSSNTTATSASEIEIRASRGSLGAINDDLGVIVIGFRLTTALSSGYISAFIRDAALSSPNPEMVRIQIGAIGVDEYRCQSLSGGTATTADVGNATNPLQAVLVVQGAFAGTYYTTDTDELTASDVESMVSGVAPTANATWVQCSKGAFTATDVIDVDAVVGIGIGNAASATTIDRIYYATRQASIT